MESAQNAEVLQSVSDIEKTLDTIVEELFEISERLKELEDAKSRLRESFFRSASEYISLNQTLAHEYVEGSFNKTTANKYLEDNHPDWRLVSIDDGGMLIEEDPSKMKFVWTTKSNIQCSRNIAIVGAKFDVDRFMQEQPNLAEQVCNAKIVYEFDEKVAQDIIDYSPELLPVFQDYATLGKVQTKLASPKVVEKENE